MTTDPVLLNLVLVYCSLWPTNPMKKSTVIGVTEKVETPTKIVWTWL